MNINKMKELLDKLDNLSGAYEALKNKVTLDKPLSLRILPFGDIHAVDISQKCYIKIRILTMNDIRKQMNQVRKEIENEIKI